jgi:hypothetical protein
MNTQLERCFSDKIGKFDKRSSYSFEKHNKSSKLSLNNFGGSTAACKKLFLILNFN